MAEEIGLFEAIHSQRAIRYFKPDPVPDDALQKVLEAAVKAPTGSNRQDWGFIVVKDPAIRSKIGEIYRRDAPPSITEDMTPGQKRMYRGAASLLEHIHEVPVLIVACIRRQPPQDGMGRAASIYPAIQNLLLAARGVGLGSVLTTRQRNHEPDVKELLGIPEDMDTAALLPLGYPAEGVRYGPTRRRPLEEVSLSIGGEAADLPAEPHLRPRC